MLLPDPDSRDLIYRNSGGIADHLAGKADDIVLSTKDDQLSDPVDNSSILSCDSMVWIHDPGADHNKQVGNVCPGTDRISSGERHSRQYRKKQILLFLMRGQGRKRAFVPVSFREDI